MHKVIVYGSKEFAKLIKQLVINCGHEFVGFIDDLEPHKDEVLGSFEDVRKKYSTSEYCIVYGIGYNSLSARWNIYNKVLSYGYETINLIHPTAIIDKTSIMGKGLIVMAGVIVDTNVKLGDLVVLWPGTVVSHDSEIESNCFLSPNSTICGFTKIGSSSFIGAGATVVNNTHVPPNSFIKAGSVFYVTHKVD
ncbi:hypothetical protein GRQ40_16645 [Anoxybacillus sp. PDR2]|uniref:PglD-related sugar-binding protein n=1 Tax=Anoxybacillus sp. PDR2 TaxID=1636720 RepID=UPI001315BD1A|nr:hypothetical protein [Anoxybacillus sp. PDR2]QHC05393.1 hypothetical protein GRQ40_16645 [Anoxybacillus sp. PDR2]